MVAPVGQRHPEEGGVKGGDSSFPGWNVVAGDNLVWSVLPHGGTLPSGIALGINYVYTPR